jgi:hypothetical protein
MQMDCALVPERRAKLKRGTNPFQVFSIENRPDLAARNPHDNVSQITSRLAAIWRSMIPEQKLIYVEYAKHFDRAQAVERRRKAQPARVPTSTFPTPRIHIVRRAGSNAVIETASLNALSMASGDAASGAVREKCISPDSEVTLIL